MSALATILSQLTGRSVEDRTGLTGSFDIQLAFFHELAQPADTAVPAPERLELGPSLFSAIEEQLGLRLDPTRGPVDMLIITNVARPSLN